MSGYSTILEILERSVGGEDIGAHGNFWRGKSRDQFVAMKVFGRSLVALGDGAGSNIVKALRGEAPFGADLVPRPPGALFRRMPAGREPVAEASIQAISDWIDQGCPDDVPKVALFGVGMAPFGIDEYVQFFREFDDFFMFNASETTQSAIGAFFGGVDSWPGFGRPEADWEMFLADPALRPAIELLSRGQLDILRRHFGDPLDLSAVADAFLRFGAGDLPPDPLRPRDPKHQMDGSQMWLVWLAFCDAAVHFQADARTWSSLTPRIVLGMVADSLFRTDRPAGDRLAINRYAADEPQLTQRVLGDFEPLHGDELRKAVIGIAQEAISQPVA